MDSSIDVVALLEQLQSTHEIGLAAEDRLDAERCFGPQWVSFVRWCELHGFANEALPLSKVAFATWLVWAAEALAQSTIVATLAAIRARHVAAGLLEHPEEVRA